MSAPAAHEAGAAPPAPLRLLGVFDATMIVVGCVVGAGVFLVDSSVASEVQSPAAFLGVWLAGGLFALCGALCNGELGAMLPRGGGEYVYLSAAFGPGLGFLSGWTSFWIAFPGSIAALAAGFGRSVTSLVGEGGTPVTEAVIGIAVVVALTIVNALGLRPGKRLLNTLGIAKVLAFAVVLAIGAAIGHGRAAGFTSLPAPEKPASLALALIPIYFAYSGWNAATYVAGELRDPRRDLARALVYGTVACIVLYLAVNAALLGALGIDGLRESTNAAGGAATRIFGEGPGKIGALLVMLAVFSSLQSTILVGPRIYQAMAEDGLFPARFGRLSKGARVPLQSIVAQGAITCVLIASGSFERLLTFATFAMVLFSIITVTAVVVLRFTRPAEERPFRTPGYPLTPAAYVLGNSWVLYNVVASGVSEVLIGLAIVLSGVPAYLYFRARRTSRT